jgi:hypothetical protein
MSIFWHLEQESMILRLAHLEEKIALQREKEKLKQFSAFGAEARTALRHWVLPPIRKPVSSRCFTAAAAIRTKLRGRHPRQLPLLLCETELQLLARRLAGVH